MTKYIYCRVYFLGEHLHLIENKLINPNLTSTWIRAHSSCLSKGCQLFVLNVSVSYTRKCPKYFVMVHFIKIATTLEQLHKFIFNACSSFFQNINTTRICSVATVRNVFSDVTSRSWKTNTWAQKFNDTSTSCQKFFTKCSPILIHSEKGKTWTLFTGYAFFLISVVVAQSLDVIQCFFLFQPILYLIWCYWRFSELENPMFNNKTYLKEHSYHFSFLYY